MKSNPPPAAAGEATLAVADAPSPRRLLAFYDRLRERARRRLAGRLGEGTTDVLLAAPDLFILLVRLFLERELPESTRALVGGALLYFLAPADLLPEALLGFGGFLDDVVVAAAVLSSVLSPDLEPLVARHWSGTTRLRVVLQDVAGTSESLLGFPMRERLLRVLRRYGASADAR